ncbi:hypothetical protein E2P81_ATG12063 [Venturia nashicola]|nr:hypothetical protein E2P81_ATG12063 [Venturia nashicola]
MEARAKVRVAVVGSGMAGLVTAYLLHRDQKQRYQVTVYEEGDQLSLDSSSISINNSFGHVDRIDLPMRAFAGGFYNHLQAMYDYLEVHYHEQPFLFSFSESLISKSRTEPYFIHSSNLHHFPPLRPKGTSLVGFVCRIVYLFACYIWYTICCFFIHPRFNAKTRVSESYAEYLTRIRLPRHFVDQLLVPLMSSVTTCPHDSLLQFPAVDLVDYKKKTHGAHHFTVSNGVHMVQEKLSRGLDTRLSTSVLSVEPTELGINVTAQSHGYSSIAVDTFDRVVLAVPPNVVGKVFSPLRDQMLRIPTIEVESVVHHAGAKMGLSSSQISEKPEMISSCRRMGQPQLIELRTSSNGTARTESAHLQPSGVTVTTCPIVSLPPEEVIQAVTFTRVLRTPESRELVNSIFDQTPREKGWRNGDDGIWLAGGWCWDGLVLLEGCEVSAMRIADAFGVEIPWRTEQ